MAERPPDGYNYGSASDNDPNADPDYYHSYEINTDDGWLRDGNGGPIMGQGIDVNLDGLQGYSLKIHQIQQNFNSLASTVIGPMQEMAMGAFGTPGQGLPWARAMAELVGHNMQKLMEFNQQISLGVGNVASAAQTVANVYGDTDAGSAATLGAVNFAFGDRGAAPDSVPEYVLDNVQTWREFQAANPGVVAMMGPEVTPMGERVTNGDTTTITVRIPQEGGPPIEMVTTQREWSVSQIGQSGVTTTVMMNGQVQTVTSTVSNGYATTTRVTQSYYDEDGNHQRDRVTSESTETWAVTGSGPSTTQTNTTSTTSYSYDENGEQTDSTTTENSLAVGVERPDVPMSSVTDDPLYQERIDPFREERAESLPQPG